MLKLLKRKFFSHEGFSLLEVMITTSVMAVLFGIITFNLLRTQGSTSERSNLDNLVSDIRSQQLKAMTGSTEGRAAASNYGVYFLSDRYTLFNGNSYNAADPTNYTIQLPEDIEITSTTLPSNTLLFSVLSGEVVGYSDSSNSIIFKSLSTNDQTVITLNRYGVITGMN